MTQWVLTGLLLAASLVARPAVAGEFQDDLKARRARVAERLGPESMLILWSAPPRVYSQDVNYEYRQESNLYYLTGIDQPETALVLMPGNKTDKEILFVLNADPTEEHWTGHRLTPAEATARSGIEKVHRTSDLDSFVEWVLSLPRPGRAFRAPLGRRLGEYNTYLDALRKGKAHLVLPLSPTPGLSEPLGPVHQFAQKVRERYVGFDIQDASDIFRDLRVIKSPYEVSLLEQSAEISSQALLDAMRATLPGKHEREVKAILEQVYKSRGAWGWSYPPIVGSGPNATTLHYEDGDRRMEAGDLLLIDAAANYEYQTVDITRTYPVSGKFSPAQRDIYALVLKAQDEAMKIARPGVSLRDLHRKTEDVIRQGLLNLGLVADGSGDQHRTWYTHSAVHFIGMDVHDLGDVDAPLPAGAAFVIEPGIYIRQEALDSLAKTPENEAFIQKVRPAVEKYKNIGVRIEDSFLLTESGLRNLSAKVPRTIEDIERFLSGTR